MYSKLGCVNCLRQGPTINLWTSLAIALKLAAVILKAPLGIPLDGKWLCQSNKQYPLRFLFSERRTVSLIGFQKMKSTIVDLSIKGLLQLTRRHPPLLRNRRKPKPHIASGSESLEADSQTHVLERCYLLHSLQPQRSKRTKDARCSIHVPHLQQVWPPNTCHVTGSWKDLTSISRSSPRPNTNRHIVTSRLQLDTQRFPFYEASP